MSRADRDLTARLAEALHASIQEASWATGVAMLDSDVAAFRDRTAAALLPAVREIAALLAADRVAAVAEELDDLYETGGAFGADNLRASVRLEKRAAALRGEAGR